MRSAIQANRGQARILQGLPAETPDTPVLNLKNFFIFLKFSHFHFASLFLQPVLFTGIFISCSAIQVHFVVPAGQFADR
jgi:hypothetical protein